jgi:hypothetical protein
VPVSLSSQSGFARRRFPQSLPLFRPRLEPARRQPANKDATVSPFSSTCPRPRDCLFCPALLCRLRRSGASCRDAQAKVLGRARLRQQPTSSGRGRAGKLRRLRRRRRCAGSDDGDGRKDRRPYAGTAHPAGHHRRRLLDCAGPGHRGSNGDRHRL